MKGLPEPVMRRCIASCLETSQYYTSKGNRALADWWHDRAEMYAEKLTIHPELDKFEVRPGRRTT
jgi:hypothetical protein